MKTGHPPGGHLTFPALAGLDGTLPCPVARFQYAPDSAAEGIPLGRSRGFRGETRAASCSFRVRSRRLAATSARLL